MQKSSSMSYFRTKQGVRLFYTYIQSKKKFTLVFIHGLGCDSAYWEQYFNYFYKDYALLFVDLRGHGKSGRPQNKEEYKMEKFSEDIIQLLSALKLKEYFLIGHSLGGVVITEVAKDNLPGLKGIVLISTPTGFDDLKKLFLLEISLAQRIPQAIYKVLQRKRRYADEKSKVMFCIKCLARNQVKVALNVLDNSKSYPGLTKFEVPHLIITFDRDEIIKNNIKKLYGKGVKVIKGRHLAFLTKYEEICSLIQEFISVESTGKA